MYGIVGTGCELCGLFGICYPKDDSEETFCCCEDKNDCEYFLVGICARCNLDE